MTSHTWTEKRGDRYSAVGASDIFAKTPVTPQLTVTGVRAVVPCATSTQEVAGAVWQDSKATHGQAVYFNSSSVVRFILAATCATAGTAIGVVGVTGIVHPLSGASALLPTLGPVTAATGTPVWQVGVAEETGIPGQTIGVRINPRQLSGLA